MSDTQSACLEAATADFVADLRHALEWARREHGVAGEERMRAAIQESLLKDSQA